MNYNDFIWRLKAAAETTDSDTKFLDYIPNIIDLAEQRCYRELDLLSTVVRDSSTNLLAGVRDFTLPQAFGRFVVMEALNIITPAGATVANGTRNRVVAISLDVLDFLWPSNLSFAVNPVPTYFAPITDQIVSFGPAPMFAYNVEVVGTVRPAPLSPTNPTTFLSLYLPDLFFAAAMIAVAGYQRDYGAQSDDPKMAQSWENQYQIFFASANVEEQRKKFSSAGWQSDAPAPLAQQPR